jgi:hypothetical protein
MDDSTRHSPAPATTGVLRLKRLCGFPLPCRLKRLVLRLRADGERPSGIAILRAYTLRDVVAAPAILGRELYFDDGILTVIDGRRPAETGLASRTSRALLVPLESGGLTARNHSGVTTASVFRACRSVSPTISRRFSACTAARIPSAADPSP